MKKHLLSIQATTCGLMATSGVLQILTDGNRLSMVRKLGVRAHKLLAIIAATSLSSFRTCLRGSFCCISVSSKHSGPLQDLDPIVNLAGSHGLIRVEWKVGICEFLLLVSLLFFVQAIRLLMYLVRRDKFIGPNRLCSEGHLAMLHMVLSLDG